MVFTIAYLNGGIIMYYEMGYMYSGESQVRGSRSNNIKDLEKIVAELRCTGFVISATNRNSQKEAMIQEAFSRDDSNLFWFDDRGRSTFHSEMTVFEKFFVTAAFFDSICHEYIDNIYNKINADIKQAGYAADDISVRRAVARSAIFIQKGAVMYIDENELYYVIQYGKFVWKIRLTSKVDRQLEKEFTYKNNRGVDIEFN